MCVCKTELAVVLYVQLISVPRLCDDSRRNVYKPGFAEWLHDRWKGKHFWRLCVILLLVMVMHSKSRSHKTLSRYAFKKNYLDGSARFGNMAERSRSRPGLICSKKWRHPCQFPVEFCL